MIQRKIKDPYIKILIYEENENIITGIEDNAGGIKVIPMSHLQITKNNPQFKLN